MSEDKRPTYYMVRFRGWWLTSETDWFDDEPESLVINPKYIVSFKPYGGGSDKTMVALEGKLFVLLDVGFENFRACIGMSADKALEERYYKVIREVEKQAVASGKTA